MTNTAQWIYDHAPLGATIRYADGTPRPPGRFRRKLQSWTSRNGSGRLTERSPADKGSRPYPATFTLHEGNHGDGHVIVLSVNKIFAVTDQRTFEVIDVPPPGSALVVQDWRDRRELLHVAADRACAEGWRDRHGYSRAHVEVVEEAEATSQAA